MLKLLLPFLLLSVGVGAGVGTALFLKPEPGEMHAVPENPCGDQSTHDAGGDDQSAQDEDETPTNSEYVKLNNQFVVPVVGENKVEALVVISLSVEVESGRREDVYAREPKLRDAFLQVLFDHANMGGFRGAFTNSNNMDILRQALQETARKVAKDLVQGVLIVDINRQDV